MSEQNGNLCADELHRRLDDAEEALRAERVLVQEELRHVRRHQDDFLAVLVHDLRNALMPIGNAIQIMQRPDSDPTDRQTALQILFRQVADLGGLVNILGDASQLGQGRIDLSTRPLLLEDVLVRAMAACQGLFDKRRHKFTTSLPPQPMGMLGDPERLLQVFTNLLNNAAKFTKLGGHIHLSALATADQLEIRIEDTGIGIAPEFLPRVFDLFAKADHGDGTPRAGLGIGLALVRKFVELHGGTVQAESLGLGRGSIFLVRLPLLSQSAWRRMQSTAPVSALASQRTRRILVVSDDANFGPEWSLWLRLAGNIVQIVSDATTAIEAIGTFKPEVVSLDLRKGALGRRELIERARQEPMAPCVIALVNAERQPRATEDGCDAVLTKPVKIRDFLQVVTGKETANSAPMAKP
jgi:nitrogen-specific signal transduction histidine kinase/ActR/RegA family two-component response regulator